MFVPIRNVFSRFIIARFAKRSSLLVALMSVTAASCNGAVSAEPTVEITSLAEARSLWTALRPVHYRMTETISCFCDTEDIRPVIVEVNGQVVTRRYADDGTAVRSEISAWFRTVDELHAFVAEAVARPVASITARYSGTTGVPIFIDLDKFAQSADDELQITVTNFRILR